MRARLLLLLSCVPACSSRESSPTGPSPPRAPAPPPALVFGLTPAHGATEASSWANRLAAYLGHRVGGRLRPFVASSYGTLLRRMAEGRVDMGWLPPAVYVTAAAEGRAAPLVKFVRLGRADYSSALIVRSDSPYRTLADLRGRRIAWIDPRSSAGYLFPRGYLLRQGIDPDAFFSNQAYLGSHRRVVEAVLSGRADIGVTFFSPGPGGEPVVSSWQQYYPSRVREIRVLASAGPIPSDVIAVRAGTEPTMRNRLRSAFLRMHEDPEGRELLGGIFMAERAIVATPSDYAAVERLLGAARGP